MADVFDSPDIVARGIAVETGPMREVVCPEIRGVVGGGTTDGEADRAGGDEGTRAGAGAGAGADADDKVVLPTLRVDVVGCFLRAARPN